MSIFIIFFDTIKMDIIHLEKYEEKHIENIKKYITSLNESEIKALKIAEEHLETSFNIVKSIGYQKWLKNNM
tara:strand:- start:831 stop:1046 length:216 start_codon:yes stop_codon:yes gene_type:complete